MSSKTSRDDLTPKQIVAELDKYIIGQTKAKKSVAIALRNRFRRKQLPEEIAEDIIPKNILMIGPTGVGKTEIARRLSRLTGSPFIKVEASKFTEVGYVGRDVESMIRDLTRIAVNMVKAEKMKENERKARENTEERILDLLLPPTNVRGPAADLNLEKEAPSQTREKIRTQLREGRLDEKKIEVSVKPTNFAPLEVFSSSGVEEIGITISEMLPNMFGSKKAKMRRMKVKDAHEYLLKEEQKKLLNMELVAKIAIRRVEQMGIVFLDEIDKISGNDVGRSSGPSVSREGVQRDLLPIIEGTTVNTKYGMVKTDHILFIGAGAFHMAKPSDMIPELQGRFPIRVELDSLNRTEFEKILTLPKNALTKQYQALLETEGLEVQFTPDAIKEVAKIAEQLNSTSENIGARRLHTIMEKTMEEISFEASDLDQGRVKIDARYVNEKVKDIADDTDLSKYIL